jgi:hypothetical protein
MFRVQKFAILIAVLLAHSGCSTPQSRCAGVEIRELRTIDMLIARTRADMKRGYATRQSNDRTGINVCLGSSNTNVGVSFCTSPTPRDRPVALDMNAEQRKLAALEAKRRTLQMTIARKTANCSTPS